MDKLAAMRAFVEIADRGSLTAAAATLGKSQPTMVRTLANLETELGARLLRRTTRRLALTDEGRGYLERCRRILEDIDEAEQSLGQDDTEPRGELRVTAPTTFGQTQVTPLVVDFLRHYSKMRVELLLLDRVVNLLEEGIDLAVRIGPLADSSMIATQVGRMRRVIVASPELLARVGEPLHPQVLSQLNCVQFRGMGSAETWHFREGPHDIKVAVRPTLVINQAIPAVMACAAGIGFGRFLAYQVAPWVSSGQLRIVLQAFERPPVPVNLVYTDARFMSPRLRVFLDFMRARLRKALDGGM